ncbi:hypothetical protein FACS189492_0540 [Clostridia bacterium]|nr:hypothetical protein FACS189492_0540 [Clostridia bacterium]
MIKRLLCIFIIASMSVSLCGFGVTAQGERPFAGKSSVTVATIGGSLTAGDGAVDYSKGWAQTLVREYLPNSFPGINFTLKNAGIGGTGSGFGMYRFQTDVAPFNPDMVFIEFAVNDHWLAYEGNTETIRRNAESLIRQCKALPSNPYVVVVILSANYMKNTPVSGDTWKGIAEYYGVPVMDLRNYIHNDFPDFFGEYSNDGTHPNADGYQLYYNKICEYLDSPEYSYYKNPLDAQQLYNKETVVKGLNRLETHNFTRIAPQNGWSIGEASYNGPTGINMTTYSTSEVGKKMNFEFQGDTLAFMSFRGSDLGSFRATVDKGTAQEMVVEFTQYYETSVGYGNKEVYTVSAGGLTDGSHTAEIENIANKGVSSSGGATLLNQTVMAYYITNSDGAIAETPSVSDNYFVYDDGQDAISNEQNVSKHGFYLLDVAADDASKFFVISERSYALAPLDASGAALRFDPAIETNTAYKMNNGTLLTDKTLDSEIYVSPATYANFPMAVMDYADPNHVWSTEKSEVNGVGGMPAQEATNPLYIADSYTFTAKLALMSRTEFNTYYENGVGFNMNFNKRTTTAVPYEVLLRSSYGPYYGGYYMNAYRTRSGYEGFIANAFTSNRDNIYQIKPVMWLGKDFFKSVRLDAATLGKNVKAMLTSVYVKSELRGIYSESELKQIGFPADFTLDVEYTPSGARLTFRNSSSSSIDAPVLITAAYNGSGTMVDADYSVLVGTVEAQSASALTNLTVGGGSFLSSYAWNSLDEKRAVTEGVNSESLPVPATISGEQLDVHFDLNSQIVTISGTTPALSGENATITVTYPGMTAADLETSTITDVYQYLAQRTVEADGRWGFTYRVRENTLPGKMNVAVTVGDSVFTGQFVCKDADFESRVLNEINKAATASALHIIFSQSKGILDIDDALWSALDDTDYLQAACAAMAVKNDFTSLDEASARLNAEMSAQMASKETTGDAVKLIMEAYNKYLKLDLQRYIGSLTAVGANEVYTSLAKTKFSSSANLGEKYIKAVILYKVNHIANYTQIKPILLAERSVLEGFGIDLSVYDRSGGSDAFDAAIALVYDTWDAFETKFKSEAAKGGGTDGGNTYDDKPSRPSGSGGSSSGGSSTVTVRPLDPNVNLPIDNGADKEARFTDLESVPWAFESVDALAKRGVVFGNGNGEFYPNSPITREEFIAMLVRALGISASAETPEFDDVQAGDWYYEVVAAAKASGITNGVGGGLFGAGREITREDAAVLAYRTLCIMRGTPTVNTTEPFADADEFAVYAENGINVMKSIGILNGRDSGSFVPKDSVTRAESAKIIYGLILYDKENRYE